MIDQINPKARRDRFGSKINRDHSPILSNGLPWLSIVFGSLVPVLPVFPTIPILPPLGFMLLLAWRLARPGLLPMWAGFVLGAVDDLYSGQPFGSAILLWSLTMIAAELLDQRFPWRNFLQDWVASAVALCVYLLMAAVVAGPGLNFAHIPYIGPQLLLAILLFPIISRLVSVLDRIRLMRIRRIG